MHLLMHPHFPLAFTPVGHVDHPRTRSILIGTPRFPISVAPGKCGVCGAKNEGSTVVIRYAPRAPAAAIHI